MTGPRGWLLLAASALGAGGLDPGECDGPLELCTAPDPGRREAGREALRRLYGARVAALARESGADPRAAVVAGILGSAAVRGAVLRVLQDPDPGLVRAAAEALARCGGSGGETELLSLLGHPEDRTALAAARALAALGPRAPVAHLVAMRDAGGRRGIAAAYALETLEPGYHREYLRRGLRKEATRARAAAAASDAGPLLKAGEEAAKALGVDPVALFEEPGDDAADREAMALLCLRLGLLQPAELAEYLDRVPGGTGDAAADLLEDPIPAAASAVARGLLGAAEKAGAAAEPRALRRIAAILRGRCSVLVPEGEPAERAAWIHSWWDRTWKDQVDGDVDAAIARGVAWLESRQEPGGGFRFRDEASTSPNGRGLSALAGYTLLKMDVPPGASSARRAADFLLKDVSPASLDRTYSVALEAMFLGELLARIEQPAPRGAPEPPRGLRGRAAARVSACGDWLVRGRVVYDAGGYGGAAWGYGFASRKGVERYDHSNSQYAVLGLLAARAAGFRVPMEVWRDVAAHWERVQCGDGGWDYIPEVLEKPRGGAEGTVSMTGAGILGRLAGLAASGGGEAAALADGDPVLRRALDLWTAKRPVPAWGRLGKGGDGQGVYYELYGLERALMVAGKRVLRDWDWYHEGALVLLRNQALDGSFGAGEADTCFALLFLKKAYVAVATR